MRGYSNDSTISLHITDACNIRCKGCYLGAQRSNRTMSMETACQAIDTFEPTNIVFFGGEATLRPDMLHTLMDRYPGINYVLHTSGTTLNTSILDRVKSIALTLDAFSYDYVRINKPMPQCLHDSVNRILQNYGEKVIITHNIHPRGNEPNFLKVFNEGLQALGVTRLVPIDWYIMVTHEEDQEYLDEFDAYHPIGTLNVQPKLRVLMDGTVTRDMTGHYNICALKDWKPRFKMKEVPVATRCTRCMYFLRCHACNMFPHFCKVVLDSVESNFVPHFCKFTHIYWTRKEARNG